LDRQEDLLAAIGVRLIGVGEQALGVQFDRTLQSQNAAVLAQVASERNLEVDARRLYVKSWVSLLDFQCREGERLVSETELASRYQGHFNDLRSADAQQDDEP
jgi:hypothetical protein